MYRYPETSKSRRVYRNGKDDCVVQAVEIILAAAKLESEGRSKHQIVSLFPIDTSITLTLNIIKTNERFYQLGINNLRAHATTTKLQSSPAHIRSQPFKQCFQPRKHHIQSHRSFEASTNEVALRPKCSASSSTYSYIEKSLLCTRVLFPGHSCLRA